MRVSGGGDLMEIEVLGDLRATRDGRPVAISNARKPRIVLACLLAREGRPVPIDSLVEAVWRDRAPVSARRNVQFYAHQLRRVLGADRILTRGGGYVVVVGEGLDAVRFQRLAEAGGVALDDGDAEAAGPILRAALDLWHGPAFAEFGDCELIVEEARRLDELRLATYERWADAQLRLGSTAQLVAELTEVNHLHPYRESLCAALMRALYQMGRQAEALAEFQRTRALLAEQLGVEPGPALRQLHEAMLRGDEDLVPPSTVVVVPRELPADARLFTGRRDALDFLDAGAARVTVICGMGGVGKTTLAVHWAHRAAERFPDGQLYVNLRGYATGRPLSSIEALGLLLRALGVAPARVPVDLDAAVGLYRTLLAGRRVLVLLDNARDVEQVRALLPGEPGCLALITSRDRLTGLVARDSARRLMLDALTPGDSRALLTRLLSDVECDASMIGDLATACGHLPLALCIAAAHLADQPGGDVAGYVDSLRSDHGLAQLEIDGDPASSVRAAFWLSYRALTGPARRLFRQLGLVPGPDITVPAGAALADVDAAEAGRLLDTLVRAHLVSRGRPGRYELHDLLRRYAHERAHAEDSAARRSAAVHRLNNHYLYTLDSAAKVMYPHHVRLDVDVPDHSTNLVDEHDAVSWVDAELTNLIAVAEHASRHEPNAVAWLLASALSGYFWLRRRHAAQWLSIGEAGLVAATARADQRGLAGAHLNLGLANRCLGRYAAAAEHANAAVSLSRQLGWWRGEAAARSEVGWVYAELGDGTRALTHLDEALAVNRRMANRAGEARVLSARSALLFRIGELHGSVRDGLAALEIFREVSFPAGMAYAYGNVALSQTFLGRFDTALDSVARELELCERIGERYGQNLANCMRAKIHLDAGRYREALECATATLKLTMEIADNGNTALALADRVEIRRHLGDTEHAVRDSIRAVELSREADNRFVEVRALIGLAEAYRYDGQLEQALAWAADARAVAGGRGFRMLEGLALTVAGETHLAAGDLAAAAKHGADALDLHHATGYRLGVLRAHAVLGRSVDDVVAAEAHREAARAIHTELGLPVPDRREAFDRTEFELF